MLRRLIAISTLILTCAGTLTAPQSADAADNGSARFVRIATGSIAGTYFPIGSLIANAISNPPGSRACEEGGSCGVPGLIAMAQTTHGSVENIDLIVRGEMDSGLVQSDIVHWAYHGLRMFTNVGPRKGIRAIARLYPESVHVVVRASGELKSIGDLAGRRVSLGAEGSGTAISAEIVLAAHGLHQDDYRAFHTAPETAADQLRQGEIDAFFIVAGFPVRIVSALAEDTDVRLLPITGAPAKRLLEEQPFFAPIEVPDGTYPGMDAVQSLSVNALWVVAANVDADLVYAMTRALWHPTSRNLLDHGHPDGKLIKLDRALDGVSIPLHEGAAWYYRERGLLN